jgi:hypothetical protein
MAEQEQWSPEEYRKYHGQKKQADANAPRLKYGNKPVIVDGRRFDSTKEAEYYGQLKLRARIGQLCRFECQVKFKLEVNGVLICFYIADFVLYHPDGSVTVVDVKGKATEGLPVFRIKKALMLALYNIKITIV